MIDIDNNKVILIKNDGTEISLMCHIAEDMILIRDTTIPVEEGDEIKYINPAGIEEVYEIDRVIYETPKGFPKDMHHIKLNYTKKGDRTRLTNQPTYNLINSTLNQNSPNSNLKNNIKIDLSKIEITDPEARNKIEELQEEINKPSKNSTRIREILSYLIAKVPDVVISIILGLLAR